eukprot:Selendium_serpulae@DN5418_c0_g1_i2.p1
MFASFSHIRLILTCFSQKSVFANYCFAVLAGRAVRVSDHFYKLYSFRYLLIHRRNNCDSLSVCHSRSVCLAECVSLTECVALTECVSLGNDFVTRCQVSLSRF